MVAIQKVKLGEPTWGYMFLLVLLPLLWTTHLGGATIDILANWDLTNDSYIYLVRLKKEFNVYFDRKNTYLEQHGNMFDPEVKKNLPF